LESDDRVRTIVLRGAGPRAFCAGGDIRHLHDYARSGGREHHEFFVLEYSLDYRVHTYPKAIVAVMDGIVMGGGMGLGQGARVRIVGDRTQMAMPETAIGLFPDVGGSYFLSRVPGRVGIYLGLAGATLTAGDALYCGLADVYVGSLEAPASRIEALHAAIERHFAAHSVEEILASLAREDDPRYREWAQQTLQSMSRFSPTMLAVTLEQLERGRNLPLADCFRMELNLIHGCFEQGDFIEGIRALIVEKDNRPRWRPSRLDEVRRTEVYDRFFKPRWDPAHHPLASLH
jgi:enoyl-CoA hydratase/carnithine racemase